jgi:hypothetical protein
MAIKTKIAKNGVQAINNDSGLDVQPMSQNIGFAPFQMYTRQVNTSQGLWTVPYPGFWFVSGSSQGGVGCTGSLPDPTANPGAELDLVCNNNFPFCISGSRSITALGQMSPFRLAFSASVGQGATFGTLVDIPGAGSIHMKSTGFQWLIYAASGSILIRP